MLKGSTIACGLAAVALAASAQAALVTFDLRATSGGAITNGGKTVTLTAPGQVTMNLYAVAGNADGQANDGAQAVQGSFLGTVTVPGMTGALAGSNVAPFTDPVAPSAPGTQADLNGDTVQDVGSLATSGGSGWFVGSAAAMQMGSEILVGSVTANITNIVPGSASTVQFVLRNKKDGTVASRNTVVYQADGIAKSEPGSSTNIAIGLPVTIQTPEPASLGLLGVGALGLLARRRQA